MALTDTIGAFCPYSPVDRQTRATGPLAGVTLGVKDLYDVADLPTGAGSPDWRATHPVPTTNAAAVQRLLDAGARLVGKTQTDELAWSLNGQNHHYGTPVNVAAPGRIPGGSSSGSAAATAAGLVDLGLGSDTGGSVRLPASYCGLFGIRTTHGRIPLDGAVPLAPSYDTVGWFSRDAALFERAGQALLPGWRPVPPPSRVLVAEDLFAVAGEACRDALAPALRRVAAAIGEGEAVDLTQGRLAAWRDAFRTIQAAEAWAAHGAWITRVRPAFGPGIRERFAAAAHVDPKALERARALRATIRARLRDIVGPGCVVLVPVAPGIAPLTTTPEADLEAFRAAALGLLCPAGHAGLPQVSLPLAMLEGCPLGLGLIGAAGEDEGLLALATTI